MWNKFGVVLLAGFQAGSFIGLFEAVRLLLAVGAGEYDALLWGGVLYGIAGLGLAMLSWVPLWTTTLEDRFAWAFSVHFAIGGWWTFSNSWWLGSILVLPWFTRVIVSRTPLRMLIQPKGAVGAVLLWCVLLSVFSLTPSRTVYSPPVHQHSAVGRNNVLWIVLDHLQEESLHKGSTPALDAQYKRSIVFDNALSDGSNAYQTVASALTGQSIQGRAPLASHWRTLPEVLAFEGYQTLAVVTDKQLGRFANLHEGFDRFRYLPPKMSSNPLMMGLRNEGAQHLKLVQSLSVFFPSTPRGVAEVMQIFTRELISMDATGAPWFAVLHLNNAVSDLDQIDRQLGHLLNNLNGQGAPVVILTGNLRTQWSSKVFNPEVSLWIQVQPSSHKIVRNTVQISSLPHTLLNILGLQSEERWNHTNMIRLPPQGSNTLMRFRHKTPQGPVDWIQDGEWRFIRQDGREHLYHISEDPRMEHNVMGHFPEQHQRMIQVLNQE